MNVAKEPIFIYRWNIFFFYIFTHIFLNHVHHMTQDTCKIIEQVLQFCAVVICVNQYDEFLFFNCTKNSAHLKIMVPGLQGPAGSSCKSGDITGWGLTEGNLTETVLDINYYRVFENNIFENTVTFSRVKWVSATPADALATLGARISDAVNAR